MSNRKDAPDRDHEASEASGTITEEVKNIGFYDYLEVDGQFFHVQTEVIPSTAPVIQTTVLEAGTVVESTVREIEAPGDGVEPPEQVARSQHDRALNGVKQGEYSRRVVEHGDN